MFYAIWEFVQSANCIAQTEYPQNVCQSADLQIGTQSADCAILIAETVEPQVLLQQLQILP